MFKITKGSESGRSMLEIVGVLGIMAIMSVGAFVLIRNAMASQRRNAVIEDFSNIVSGVRALFADQDDLRDLRNNGAEVLAAIAIDPNNTPYDGATYTLNLDIPDAEREDLRRFVVSIAGLPRRDCIVLSQRPWIDSVDVVASCDWNVASRNSLSVHYRK